VPTFATGFEWNSESIIFRAGRLGSIVEIKRIQGPIFNSKEAAEQRAVPTVQANHLRSFN